MHGHLRWLACSAVVVAYACGRPDEPQPAKAQPDTAIVTSSTQDTIASEVVGSPESLPRKGVFKAVVSGGPGCKNPDDATMKEYDKYGAWHFCFSYAFRKEASIFSDVTNAVYDVITVGVPPLKYVDLYQPASDVLRFQVAEQGSYRLYAYWTRDIGNVPPPGKYTDHQFRAPKERSIDYWWKLRQRGTGKNARISGVAEVIFVPDELCSKARKDGFFANAANTRPCPQ